MPHESPELQVKPERPESQLIRLILQLKRATLNVTVDTGFTAQYHPVGVRLAEPPFVAERHRVLRLSI
jgi:hypothetical protein